MRFCYFLLTHCVEYESQKSHLAFLSPVIVETFADPTKLFGGVANPGAACGCLPSPKIIVSSAAVV
jgi:hypothetical protein